MSVDPHSSESGASRAGQAKRVPTRKKFGYYCMAEPNRTRLTMAVVRHPVKRFPAHPRRLLLPLMVMVSVVGFLKQFLLISSFYEGAKQQREEHIPLLPLRTLTRIEEKDNKNKCPSNLVFRSNKESTSFSDKPRKIPKIAVGKIPKIVHQTCKSRCLSQRVFDATEKWLDLLDDSWSYYFYDDEAVMRLLLHTFPEFPHLEVVARNCLVHGALKADLWRYLVLWAYGGYYADVDCIPAKFNMTMLHADTDALFVVEQYHLLSQWFMAVSPRHPLMYYAVQVSLWNLLQADDTGSIQAPMTTGPHALHTAYRMFRKDDGVSVARSDVKGKKPVWAGHFVGTHNRTVTVIGVGERQNEFVNRDVLRGRKDSEYQQMGIRHFSQDQKHASGKSCLMSLYDSIGGIDDYVITMKQYDKRAFAP